MKYRYLGNSGLAVSTICLGTATFGQNSWGCDKVTSVQILNAFVENGGNFIDTADQYAETETENIIGDWLSGHLRDEIVLATKCFFQTGKDINSRGLSKKHIISACEASLKRLKTDYVDIYQIHNLDPQTPLEETLAAFDILIRQGKVRYIGLSNFPAWKVVKIQNLATNLFNQYFVSAQYLYNLLKRDIEIEIIPALNDCRIGLMCWSPLSGGMLTGKYINKVEPPINTRFNLRTDVVKNNYGEWIAKSDSIVKCLIDIARKCEVHPSIIAIAWLLNKINVSSVIVGVKSQEQILENIVAGNWHLNRDDFEELDNISKIDYGYPYDVNYKTTQGWYDIC